MKNKPFSIKSAARRIASSEPIPSAVLGYLLGLTLSFIASLSVKEPHSVGIAPLPFSSAIKELIALELPFWIACTLLGLGRLPHAASLPLCLRSFLWGYGSLQFYLLAGKSVLYFVWILGSGITLLPLFCLTRLARRTIRSPRSNLFRYLCQCLYFWGLTLIILFLRCIAGMYMR